MVGTDDKMGAVFSDHTFCAVVIHEQLHLCHIDLLHTQMLRNDAWIAKFFDVHTRNNEEHCFALTIIQFSVVCEIILW